MDHNPFFDTQIYPAHRPEAIAFHAVLCDVYNDVPKTQNILIQCGGRWQDLTTGQTLTDTWHEILRLLSTSGQLRVLCEHVLKRPNNHPQTITTVQAVLNATYSSHQKRVISNRLFVFDRSDLTDDLTELVIDQSPLRVIVVRGDTKSGKSHCRYPFQEMAKERTNYEAIYLSADTVSSGVEGESSLDTVLKRLFGYFDANVTQPPTDQSASAWYDTVALELLKLARNQRKEAWIVVDDLGYYYDEKKQEVWFLDKPVRDFFNQFARNMSDPSFGRWFRFMFIHYPPGKPPKWQKDFYIEESVRSSDISVDDVAECLRLWAESQRVTLLEEKRLTYAQDILNSVDNYQPPADVEPESRLERMHKEFVQLVRKLKPRTP